MGSKGGYERVGVWISGNNFEKGVDWFCCEAYSSVLRCWRGEENEASQHPISKKLKIFHNYLYLNSLKFIEFYRSIDEPDTLR